MLKLFKKLKYISISSRISILLGIIILLTMGVFSVFSLLKQEDTSIDAISHNTEQLSRTTEKILRLSMLKNRRDELSMAVKDIIGKEGIMSVRILNHKGIIKFSSRSTEIDKHISQTSPAVLGAGQLCQSCHKNKFSNPKIYAFNSHHLKILKKDNLILNWLPIYNAKSCYTEACHATSGNSTNMKMSKAGISYSPFHDSSQTILGFIEIEVSTKRINSNLKKASTELILFTVIFALIASLITYISIKYLIGKPIKNLVDGTKRVAEGNFTDEIPPGKAELGLLSESFNKMQMQLLATQTQLIESEKLASVGKLAEEIANEINNPLTGIIIHSESLISESRDDDKNSTDYKTIRLEALKIRESIRNILSFTAGSKPEYKITSIGKIIHHSISVVKNFSNFQNIKIILEVPKTLPEVSVDPSLMEQVFLNILLISSDFMPTGGILDITAKCFYERSELEIVFSDTGKGIPENILQRTFDTANISSLGNLDRTGISLAVCKDIIEMHKGTLKINNTASGKVITVILPGYCL